MAARKTVKLGSGPWPQELWRVRALISEGKSDGAIAATISADRPFGAGPIDPRQIAFIRAER